MKLENKTKQEIIDELTQSRRRIAELESAESERKQSEESLKESEAKYRVYVDNSPNGIFITDSSGRFIDVNVASFKLLGYSRDEILDMSIPDALAPESLEAGMKGFETLIKTGSFDSDLSFTKKDGSKVFMYIATSKISEDRFIVVCNDVTDHKLAEEALRESENSLNKAQEIAHVGSWQWNLADNTFVLSDEMCRIYGITDRSQFTTLRSHLDGIIHPDDEERITQAANEVADSGAGGALVYRVLLPNEKILWIEAAPPEVKQFDKNGHPKVVVGTVQDITERKQAEETLQESEAKYAAVVQQARDGIVIVQDGVFKFVNQGWDQICGYTSEELIGTSFLETLLPESRELVAQRFEQRIKGEDAPSTYEVQIHNKSGIVKILEVSAGLIQYQGEPADMAVLRDITERKQTEEALRKAYEEMESKVQERTVDLKNANKELQREIAKRKKVEKGLNESREQLRELSRYLQSLAERERTAVSREIHDGMGQALTALKMDISWLNSKLTSKQKPLVDKAESMSRLIDNTIHEVQRFASQLRPKMLDDLGIVAAIEWQTQDFQSRTGIMCELSPKPGKNFTLNSDLSTMIFRISQETLTNITRHAEATRVSISLRDKAGKLIMEITDNGKGITHEQISSSASLGLIGMRERVTAFGGKLKIKGMRGGGTKLTVTIPHRKDGKA